MEGGKSRPKYSILLPTYNEKENLPLIIWLLVKFMSERFVFNRRKIMKTMIIVWAIMGALTKDTRILLGEY